MAVSKKLASSILDNRALFLSELRSGKYKKGTIKSDEKGYPVFESEEDKDGYCCCAIMIELFGKTEKNKYSLPKAIKSLGLTSRDCQFIQQDINDSLTSLSENADRIEFEVFNKKQP